MIQKVSNAPSISWLSLHNVQNSSERNVKRGRNEGVEKWELAGLGERGTNKTVSVFLIVLAWRFNVVIEILRLITC